MLMSARTRCCVSRIGDEVIAARRRADGEVLVPPPVLRVLEQA